MLRDRAQSGGRDRTNVAGHRTRRCSRTRRQTTALKLHVAGVDDRDMSIMKRSSRFEDEAAITDSFVWEVDPGSLNTWIDEPALSHPGVPGGDQSDVVASDEPGTAVAHRETVPSSSHEEEFWEHELLKAISTLRSDNTPDSWGAMARVADLISDVAQVMERFTKVRESAADKERCAQEAQHRAKRAAVLVEEAERKAQETARTATEAEQAAERARREASEAKEHATKAAQDVLVFEEAASIALRESDSARNRADEMAAAVSQARQAKSADAWSEALRVVSRSSATDDGALGLELSLSSGLTGRTRPEDDLRSRYDDRLTDAQDSHAAGWCLPR